MPHAELRHSNDLTIDHEEVFIAIEDAILALDPGAGETKCRAYPTPLFRHTHCIVEVTMLARPHRDKPFAAAAVASLTEAVTAHLPSRCFFSLGLQFSDENYITIEHRP